MLRSSHCRSYWIPHHSAIKSRDNALPSICSGWKWLANWKCKIGTRAEWVQQRLRNNSTMMIMAVMIMVMLVTIMDTIKDYDYATMIVMMLYKWRRLSGQCQLLRVTIWATVNIWAKLKQQGAAINSSGDDNQNSSMLLLMLDGYWYWRWKPA